MKESDKHKIYALLWSIWAAVHLYVGVIWIGVLIGIMGLGYWIASIVASIKEAKEDAKN